MMTDQRKHVAHGMTHERTAALHWLRTDERLRNALMYELCGLSARSIQSCADDICEVIAANIEGAAHWDREEHDNDDAQSRTDDTHARAAV